MPNRASPAKNHLVLDGERHKALAARTNGNRPTYPISSTEPCGYGLPSKKGDTKVASNAGWSE